MYCSNCGKQIENPQSKFCPMCGAVLDIQGERYNSQTTSNYSSGMNNYQQPTNYQRETDNYSQNYNNFQPNLSMKWYKFVIYFQLFCSGFFAVITALRTMTGDIYDMEDVSVLYETFPALKSTDIVVGIIWIAYALFGVFYIRKQLVNFKSTAIISLLVYYLANPVIETLSTVISMGIVDVSFSDIGSNGVSEMTGIWMGTIVLVILSYIYFNKRKHMFTN